MEENQEKTIFEELNDSFDEFVDRVQEESDKLLRSEPIMGFEW